MIASDFMTKKVVTCNVDQTVDEAAKIMIQNGFSVMPVVDSSGVLVGIVTESDFVGKEVKIPHALASIKQLFGQIFYFRDIESIYAQAKKMKLSEVMSRKPVTVTPSTSLTDIVNLLISKNLKRLPVVENQKLVGIITRKDLLRAFNKTQVS
jgi:CBS domain-containing protein